MKNYLRGVLCRALERRVVELRAKHDFTVVAVAGSVGKTSTKLAVARLLEATGKKVQYQEGNYNDRVSVPLVFFGETMPSLFNIFAWASVLLRMSQQIKQPYQYDAVVVELGTDGPGQLKDFAYIQPDIIVVSAISPEHMLQFGTLDAVAEEELAVAEYSKKLLVNVADVDLKYLEGLKYVSYGVDVNADYRATQTGVRGVTGQRLAVSLPDGSELQVETAYSGKQGATIVLAAIAVADILGVEPQQMSLAAASLQPFAGRLQVLEGTNGSILIDDTYNSSPLATRAALDVLYQADAKQKIAILGDMNELGDSSADEHRDLGAYCRADELDYVITIGTKSCDDLAPAAEAAGCRVKSFTSAVEAGKFVRAIIAPGALILAKGSQNGVFAEEAVKQLLKHSDDTSKLVRQSEEWLAKKRTL
jgi:UDP-N-acetylmuramoyl-tripeptide--D-alanyl-D-alanine ligase